MCHSSSNNSGSKILLIGKTLRPKSILETSSFFTMFFYWDSWEGKIQHTHIFDQIKSLDKWTPILGCILFIPLSLWYVFIYTSNISHNHQNNMKKHKIVVSELKMTLNAHQSGYINVILGQRFSLLETCEKGGCTQSRLNSNFCYWDLHWAEKRGE